MANLLVVAPTLLKRDFARKDPPKTRQKPINMMGIGSSRELSFTVMIGGVRVPLFKSWQTEQSSYSPGSSATVVIPVSHADDLFLRSTKIIPMPITIATTMFIDGDIVFDDTNEFAGIIDTMTLNRRAGTYSIQARSYAQVLLNVKTNEAISGPAARRQTTAQAVKTLVTKYAPTMKTVIGDFKTPVDSIYKQTGTLVTRNVPVWDLIQNFAAHDGADLFVHGDTLYYVQPAVEKNPDITELKGVTPDYTYEWGKNILDLEIVHSPLFAHDVTVTVNSVSTRTGETATATATMTTAQVNATAKKLELNKVDVERMNEKSKQKLAGKRKGKVTSDRTSAAKIGNKSSYTSTIPNASPDDCDRVANQIMRDISAKEFLATLTVLGQPDFNPRQIINIVNSGSESSDQPYAIKSITKGFTAPESGGECEGYKAVFMLVNHHVQTTGVAL